MHLLLGYYCVVCHHTHCTCAPGALQHEAEVALACGAVHRRYWQRCVQPCCCWRRLRCAATQSPPSAVPRQHRGHAPNGASTQRATAEMARRILCVNWTCELSAKHDRAAAAPAGSQWDRLHLLTESTPDHSYLAPVGAAGHTCTLSGGSAENDRPVLMHE